MSITIHHKPPPVPWGDKLGAIPKAPAVVPEKGHDVSDERGASLIQRARSALAVLESFTADAARVSAERFTLEDLAARGGVTGILKKLDVSRLNESQRIVAELRKAIGNQGKLALEWGPGGFVPEYSTVESLAEQVNACEAYALSLERTWSAGK